MSYALIVLAIFCLGITAALASLARYHKFEWLLGLDFVVTTVVLFAVIKAISTPAASTGEALLTAVGIAGTLSLFLLAIRYLDRRVVSPQVKQASKRHDALPFRKPAGQN